MSDEPKQPGKENLLGLHLTPYAVILTSSLVTAAETITIGAGSCDDGAGNGEGNVLNSDGADKKDKKKDKNKEQNMGDGQPGMGKMDKTKGKGKMDQSHETDKYKDGMGNKGKGETDEYQDNGRIDQTKENGEMDQSDRMEKNNHQDIGKDHQDMRKTDASQDTGEVNESSGMNKDKWVGQDRPMMGYGEMGSRKTKTSDISQDDMAQTSKDKKAMLLRRQRGGRVGWMFTHFMASDDTMIIPAYMGAPEPVPGIVLMDDPARDTAYEDEILMCGVDS